MSPPAYAELLAGMERVGDAAEVPDAAWLTPTHTGTRATGRRWPGSERGTRASAGRRTDGARRAQVDALSAVNQCLREADLAMATTERVFAKHIAGADANRMLILTVACPVVDRRCRVALALLLVLRQ